MQYQYQQQPQQYQMGGYVPGTANAGRDTGNLSSQRTKLVQRRIQSLEAVHDEFTNTGANGDEVCIVAVPRLGMGSNCYLPCLCLGGCSCFHCLVSVPSGPYVLWQSFGANQVWTCLEPHVQLCDRHVFPCCSKALVETGHNSRQVHA